MNDENKKSIWEKIGYPATPESTRLCFTFLAVAALLWIVF